MAFPVSELPDRVLEFLRERHLATLSLVQPDGSLHVTPVGFSWDDAGEVARVITFAGAKKTRILEAHAPVVAALSQVDGGRWLTLHGAATITADPAVNADAEQRYGERYRPPGDRGNDRRTIEIAVDSIVGRVPE